MMRETQYNLNVLLGTSYRPQSFWDNFLLIVGTFPAIPKQLHLNCSLSVGPEFEDCQHDILLGRSLSNFAT